MTSDLLTGWLKGVPIGDPLMVSVTAKPVPATRPRFNRRTGSVYHTANYMEFLNVCQKDFSKTRFINDWPEGPLEGPLGVVIDIRSERPKSTKLSHPRGDADNYAKGPLDAGTKCGLWGDDAQITELRVVKRWAEEGEEAGAALWVVHLAA